MPSAVFCHRPAGISLPLVWLRLRCRQEAPLRDPPSEGSWPSGVASSPELILYFRWPGSQVMLLVFVSVQVLPQLLQGLPMKALCFLFCC
mmetsp:Transcript_61106/g.136502  ORF Transcript_61106/g.136502 Transcript_61106/m.136502 type:complete len:90 (+) Transcript_61106:334-603(+)